MELSKFFQEKLLSPNMINLVSGLWWQLLPGQSSRSGKSGENNKVFSNPNPNFYPNPNYNPNLNLDSDL